MKLTLRARLGDWIGALWCVLLGRPTMYKARIAGPIFQLGTIKKGGTLYVFRCHFSAKVDDDAIGVPLFVKDARYPDSTYNRWTN